MTFGPSLLTTESSWVCLRAVTLYRTTPVKSFTHSVSPGNIIWYWAVGRDVLWVRGDHWPASRNGSLLPGLLQCYLTTDGLRAEPKFTDIVIRLFLRCVLRLS